MRNLQTVYHLGSLKDLEHAVGRKIGNSYEGNCLSVSVHPRAWRQIAKLGGSGILKLTHDSPRWCDALDPQVQSQAIEWAVSEGLLRPAKTWRLWQTDENDEESFFSYNTKGEALSGACVEHDEELEDFGYWLEEVEGTVVSDISANRFESETVPAGDCTHCAVVWWAESQGFDGVWREEELDVHGYSAPRGGIFQGKIENWNVQKLKQLPGDDE